MNVIHKISLRADVNTCALPLGTEILHVAIQHGEPTMWYRRPVIPPTLENRNFLLVGTGYEFPEGDYRFIGTMMSEDQDFVFHVFEIVDPQG